MFKPGSDAPRARSRAASARAVGDALRPATSAASPVPRSAVPQRRVADDHPIALIQTNSLPSLVQRELERMILAGDLPAGSKLREAEVASMLGVSRGPVREAFRAVTRGRRA